MADTVAVIYSTCAFTVYPSLVVSAENTKPKDEDEDEDENEQRTGGKKSVRKSLCDVCRGQT